MACVFATQIAVQAATPAGSLRGDADNANGRTEQPGQNPSFPNGITNRSSWDIDPVSDKDFNAQRGAILLNGNVFVKDEVGINVDSVCRVYKELKLPFVIRDINARHDSLVVTQDPREHPFTINGVEYDHVVQLELKNFKDVRLASLEGLKEKHFPDLKGPYIFMINRNFITHDVASYKVDENFVYDMQVVPSADFESLQGLPPFSIIRIFTKTPANIPPVRLR